jgi:hypothetical protein
MARLDVSRLSDGGGIYTPPAMEDPGIAADRKIAADIAAATGQKVDPRTGQIIIDPTAIAKKFPTTASVPVVEPQKTAAQLAAEAQLRAAELAAKTAAAESQAGRQSAYDLLYSQFKTYGLESLVEPLKGLITTGVSPAEFTIKLRDTDAYKKRFSANAARVQKGLRALDEAEYIALEDQYQNVMRNYGLPSSYYEKGAMGVQPGFTNLIAGNVSAAELESRVQQAVDVVEKGPKEYVDAIKQFYPDISRGDLLAYVLDPEKALTKIQARIGAAKIGGEYLRGGLATDVARAEELPRQGVQAVQALAPRGGMLSEIYQTGPYGQAQVEEEVYGLAGASEAKKRREKLTALETASFSGSSGAAQGALGRERAMGQGQF